MTPHHFYHPQWFAQASPAVADATHLHPGKLARFPHPGLRRIHLAYPATFRIAI